MTEGKLREYHATIAGLWKFMKEYLTRTDNKTDPDKYWADLVDNSYHGPDEFKAKIYVAAIREIERAKK